MIFISKRSIASNKKADLKPNIVLIYDEDMDYRDADFLGATDIWTPETDKLAKEGVYLIQTYASTSVSWTSRAWLMTGVYQLLFWFGENPPDGAWYDGKYIYSWCFNYSATF